MVDVLPGPDVNAHLSHTTKLIAQAYRRIADARASRAQGAEQARLVRNGIQASLVALQLRRQPFTVDRQPRDGASRASER